jgi:hypothetical protein
MTMELSLCSWNYFTEKLDTRTWTCKTEGKSCNEFIFLYNKSLIFTITNVRF